MAGKKVLVDYGAMEINPNPTGVLTTAEYTELFGVPDCEATTRAGLTEEVQHLIEVLRMNGALKEDSA